jgi:cell division septum initiation protein DivIVA
MLMCKLRHTLEKDKQDKIQLQADNREQKQEIQRLKVELRNARSSSTSIVNAAAGIVI